MKKPIKSHIYSCLSVILKGCSIPFALLTVLMLFTIYELGKQSSSLSSRLNQNEAAESAFLLYAIVGFVSLIIAIALAWWSDKVKQKGTDKYAESIINLLENGLHLDFFLYLRPFSTTGKLNTEPGGRSPFLIGTYLRSVHHDLENKIAKALKRQGTLLALGTPGQVVGAGRVPVSETEWKEKVQFLSIKAKCIICIPGYSSGSRWEIVFLRNSNCFNKTVFIMPPKSPLLDMAIRWEETREQFHSDNLKLPEYNPSGLIFSMNEEGIMSRSNPLLLLNNRSLRRGILSLTSRMADNCT